MKRIAVSVFKRKRRTFYIAQWKDPTTGRWKTCTTKKERRRDAERFATKLEEQLNTPQARVIKDATWADARDRYKSEVLAGLKEKSAKKVVTTFNVIEKSLNPPPAWVHSLNANAISRFQKLLRDKGRSSETIIGHLVNISGFLKWAVDLDMIVSLPAIRKPPAVEKARGRAIATEEFERMKLVAGPVLFGTYEIKQPIVDSWLHLLDGLWWSGLRITEAMLLHWTDDSHICVEFDGRRPMFRIQGASDKGGKFRLFPMAPEFAKFLERTPVDQRKGFVFNPSPVRKPFDVRLPVEWVSKRITKLGEKAKVKVNDIRRQPKPGEMPKPKFASAHDLRRAFGFRWAMRVLPPVLQELMRHESITTTMKYYVGKNAEMAADVVWSAFTDTSTDTGRLEQRIDEVGAKKLREK